MAGSGVEADRGDGSAVKADIADEAIRSPSFWGYMRMLDQVAEVMLELSAWAEGCPCHSCDAQFQGCTRHQRATVFRRTFDVDGCPLRTMRAPELASGIMKPLLGRLLTSVNTTLVLDPAISVLPPDTRASVLQDFAALRRHITFTFALKLGFWQQLPWILAGVAHVDPIIARKCGQRALFLADNIPDLA